MPIQQLSCDFNHLSMTIHLGPCRSHPCSRTSTEGAAVITGTGWRRGGGACGARPTVVLRLGRPDACRSVVAPPKGEAPASSREDRPSRTTTGPWLWPLDAPVRPIGRGTKAVERGRSGREDAARGRRATGILKLKKSWSPASRSLAL